MPTYSYVCGRNEKHEWERICSIMEMEEFEREEHLCPCGGVVRRMLKPPGKHVTFHAGFYEHISEEGAYISTMSELRRVAKDNGNYSQYGEDLGGLFRAKEGRWV